MSKYLTNRSRKSEVGGRRSRLILLTSVLCLLTSVHVFSENVNVTDHQLKTTKPLPVTVVPPATGSPTPQQVTILDGKDITQGAKADAPVTNTAASGSVIAWLKGLMTVLRDGSQITQVKGGPLGAPSYANNQVAASTTAGTLIAARATRRSVTIRNTDATITVYIGAATVTAGNGMPLKAGESINIDSVALIQVLAASGTPAVAYIETYD